MTTGMSAPPIGMMMSTPSTNAIAVIAMNGGQLRAGRRQRRTRCPRPIISEGDQQVDDAAAP